MATNNGNFSGNHSKGKGIQPGSLVMLKTPKALLKNPSNGKIFTAMQKASSVGQKLTQTEQTDDAWILDKPIHLWKFRNQAWEYGYNGPVPAKYLIPISDPDADLSEDTDTTKEKNKCESI